MNPAQSFAHYFVKSGKAEMLNFYGWIFVYLGFAGLTTSNMDIIVYFIAQKQKIKGVPDGAVK
ncbi:hypothetical protein BTO30_10405 [Domibacillus antri]|uniref:Uncharacterized protein n=1 Tax=Domibacillus antri TaxID=1714264 RepID=A0A1Q8Q4A3_9BACI|nr:hypothetical protein BTO30_10405 [Domibacillus antri]